MNATTENSGGIMQTGLMPIDEDPDPIRQARRERIRSERRSRDAARAGSFSMDQ